MLEQITLYGNRVYCSKEGNNLDLLQVSDFDNELITEDHNPVLDTGRNLKLQDENLRTEKEFIPTKSSFRDLFLTSVNTHHPRSVKRKSSELDNDAFNNSNQEHESLNYIQQLMKIQDELRNSKMPLNPLLDTSEIIGSRLENKIDMKKKFRSSINTFQIKPTTKKKPRFLSMECKRTLNYKEKKGPEVTTSLVPFNSNLSFFDTNSTFLEKRFPADTSVKKIPDSKECHPESKYISKPKQRTMQKNDLPKINMSSPCFSQQKRGSDNINLMQGNPFGHFKILKKENTKSGKNPVITFFPIINLTNLVFPIYSPGTYFQCFDINFNVKTGDKFYSYYIDKALKSIEILQTGWIINSVEKIKNVFDHVSFENFEYQNKEKMHYIQSSNNLAKFLNLGNDSTNFYKWDYWIVYHLFCIITGSIQMSEEKFEIRFYVQFLVFFNRFIIPLRNLKTYTNQNENSEIFFNYFERFLDSIILCKVLCQYELNDSSLLYRINLFFERNVKESISLDYIQHLNKIAEIINIQIIFKSTDEIINECVDLFKPYEDKIIIKMNTLHINSKKRTQLHCSYLNLHEAIIHSSLIIIKLILEKYENHTYDNENVKSEIMSILNDLYILCDVYTRQRLLCYVSFTLTQSFRKNFLEKKRRFRFMLTNALSHVNESEEIYHNFNYVYLLVDSYFKTLAIFSFIMDYFIIYQESNEQALFKTHYDAFMSKLIEN